MKTGLPRLRPVFVFFFVCLCLSLLLLRIACIENGSYRTAAAEETEREVTLATSRGMIYDRNGIPLVNTKSENLAVIIADDENITKLTALTGKDYSQVQKGACIRAKTDTPIEESASCINLTVYTRYGEPGFLRHLLGYTDNENKGVAGLERSFDRILSDASGSVGIRYEADGYGLPLAGEGLEVQNDNYGSKAGLVLTIDSRIQTITENALSNSGITCGAAVVLKTDTAEILAMASLPVYDVNNLAASLEDENTPFVNRAVSCYPVGSVFKPFVAAAALKAGKNADMGYTCNGYEDIDGVLFHCYNNRAHGEQHLTEAIGNSCNCYFINMGLSVGAEKLSETCSLFGFHKEIKLTADIVNSAGSFPETSSSAKADLANLSFGQGSLTASPLQLAAAFNTLAADGIYRTPYLVKKLVDGEQKEYAYYENEPSVTVLQSGEADIINRCLYENMLTGTGVKGNPSNASAAGKTATAQTGKYDETGKEQLCTWFCGFFPYENPAYTVVIFNEKGSTASVDCAPVFKEIAENITDCCR